MNTIDRLVRDHQDVWSPADSPWNTPVSGGSTPEQYGIPADAEELQDLIEYREMSFALGNIFKACYRLGLKDSTDVMYDLQKMKWFTERLIAQEKNK